MEEGKEEFLKEFGQDYGYPNAPKNIDEIRNSEFKRLDGLVYLDHAGATLYSESQMEAVFKDLSSSVYGNPHSQSDSSSATSDIIRAARQQVLDFCNASLKAYKCIFTSGATAALKLVGEAFPWSSDSCYMYTMENHNSVLGIREYALKKGAAALAVDIEKLEQHDELDDLLNQTAIELVQHPIQRRVAAKELAHYEKPGGPYNLFAFPSECNFSGLRFDLNLVNLIKRKPVRLLQNSTHCRAQWLVLVDAAKGCSTQPIDLARFPADFVVLSFYKIFGYPTGLGALVVRTEAADLLEKIYFSGGTVAASIADIDFVKRRKTIEEWFEDGTQSFLSIASIVHGFKIVNTLTMSAISRHTKSLTSFVRRALTSLRHGNGAPVCVLYDRSFLKVPSWDHGPVITFNLKRLDGSWFGYREVEKLSSLSGIQLRTGCFCNPGACSKFLGLSHSDLLANVEAGHVCWDDYDVIKGKPTGAVRISFGYMSTYEDAKIFISFIVSSFVSKKCLLKGEHLEQKMTTILHCEEGPGKSNSKGNAYLESIVVYPIKSCGGFSVDFWPLGANGLRYDREWLLRGTNGEILTQKKVPEMSIVTTEINLTEGKMVVKSRRCEAEIQINVGSNFSEDLKEEIDVYGQRYEVLGYNDEVNFWFTKAVGRSCTLHKCLRPAVRESLNKCNRGQCRDIQSNLSFVNEAQLLLISKESVADLNDKLNSEIRGKNGSTKIAHVHAMRFRPNLVISGSEPYVEDSWRSLYIGNEYFTSLGGCNRCHMINLDLQGGEVQKSKEPLATLATYRRTQGRILFGILLKYERSASIGDRRDRDLEPSLEVGQRIRPRTL